jgi:hypothetical protein
LGFLIVLALINLAGLATCCVGLFITFPITFAALAYAYEDIPGATASPPGASSSIPSSAPPTPPTPPPDRFWRRFAVTVLALIILVPVGILTLGVLLPVVAQRQIEKHEHNAVQTLAEQPPVVVETWPVSGARNVEPGIAEIRVRFSKEMTDGSWSWSTAWENSTPETVGQIHYETDQRTCVLKAKLEPGRTYAWWLNSDKFKNFTDIAGRPAVPYLLIFQTKPN